MSKRLFLIFTTLFIMIFLVACNKKEESEEIIDILYGHVENDVIVEKDSDYELVRYESKVKVSEHLNCDIFTNNYVVTNYPYA